jgi:hypothetical protein
MERLYIGRLKITRTSTATWKGRQVGQGFKVTIYVIAEGEKRAKYKQSLMRRKTTAAFSRVQLKKTVLDHEDLGIEFSFTMNDRLQDLFSLNGELLATKLEEFEKFLRDYRQHYRDILRYKDDTLSYAFFTDIYCDSEVDEERLRQLLANEGNPYVRDIVDDYSSDIICLYIRLRRVYRSEIHACWYIFWDDFYRRNWKVIPQFKQRISDFSPYSPTSICYRPMSRSRLESFIAGPGNTYSKSKGVARYLHPGVLNCLYKFLADVVQSHSVPSHLSGTGQTTVSETMPMPEASYIPSFFHFRRSISFKEGHRTSTSYSPDEEDVRFPEPSRDGHRYW